MEKICLKCGVLFSYETRVGHGAGRPRKFCDDCRGNSRHDHGTYLSQNQAATPLSKLGVRGAISELRVCCDLLSMGYEVFRAVAPSCSCDLAVLRDGKLLRIEVKTGRYNGRGAILYGGAKESEHDVLAIVLHDRIEYRPREGVEFTKP